MGYWSDSASHLHPPGSHLAILTLVGNPCEKPSDPEVCNEEPHCRAACGSAKHEPASEPSSRVGRESAAGSLEGVDGPIQNGIKVPVIGSEVSPYQCLRPWSFTCAGKYASEQGVEDLQDRARCRSMLMHPSPEIDLITNRLVKE